VKGLRQILILALIVFLLDQASKAWLIAALPVGRRIELTSFFNLVHLHNPGVAFGIWSSGRGGWYLLALTIVGGLVLLAWAIKTAPKSLWGRVGVGLALGGAAGNIVDRWRFAAVVDFLDLHWRSHHWPAFNLADASLTIGLALLIVTLWLKRA